MAEYDFSLVDVAIIDTQHHGQRVMREVLGRLGIRRVTAYDSVREAASGLKGDTPDLLLIDADEEEADAFTLVRTLRNDPRTSNPFACLIVTTWQPTPKLVLRVSNSGADDLLVKPVSPKQVQDRIVTLIRDRRGFVVTSEYTGPDRRKSPRGDTQIPLLDVPNTLRLKASGRWGTTNTRQLMVQSIQQVSKQKVLRSSVQAAFLVEFARPGLVAAVPERMALEHLARVPGVVDELLRRLPADEDVTAARTVANALKQCVTGIHAGVEAGGRVNLSELSQAMRLSQELMQVVDPNRPLGSLVREVEVSVSGYRTRLEMLAQAKAAEAARAAAEAAEAGQARAS